jgi:hypothetical protein
VSEAILAGELGLDVSEIRGYNVYSDNRTGTIDEDNVLFFIEEDGRASGLFDGRTPFLQNGTWKFVVRPVDLAGNELKSVRTCQVVIAARPKPPTDLEVTFNPTTKRATITFTPSVSDDVSSYELFGNSGSCDAPDPTTVIATSAGSPILSPVLTPGDWVLLLQAVNPYGNDQNLTQLVELRLDGTPAAPTEKGIEPNDPIEVVPIPLPDGAMRIRVYLDPRRQEVEPAKVRLYEELDFTTPVDEQDVDLPMVDVEIVEFDRPPFYGSRRYTARTVSADGVESLNDGWVIGTADHYPPSEVQDFACAAVPGE